MYQKINQENDTIDFIGVGAPRCGTTWLSKCLEEHPSILMSSEKSRKELNYFIPENDLKDASIYCSSNNKKSLKKYLKQFPSFQKGCIRGEFSVSYLKSSNACQNIKKTFPDSKILVVLRNPVDMIHSLYFHNKTSLHNNNSEDFYSLIKKDKTFLENVKFYKQLKIYLEEFPVNNVHVMFLEDFEEDKEKEFKKLFIFLGVDSDFTPLSSVNKINVSKEIRFKFIHKFLIHVFLIIKKHSKKTFDLLTKNYFLIEMYSFINKINKKREPLDIKIRLEIEKDLKEDVDRLGELIDRDLSKIWF